MAYVMKSDTIKVFKTDRDLGHRVVQAGGLEFLVRDRSPFGSQLEVNGDEVILRVGIVAPGLEFHEMPAEIEERWFEKTQTENSSTSRTRRLQRLCSPGSSLKPDESSIVPRSSLRE